MENKVPNAADAKEIKRLPGAAKDVNADKPKDAKEETAKKPKKKKKTLRQRFAQRKLGLFVWLIIIALFVVIIWPYVTVTVEAGYVGVYFSRFFGGTLVDRPFLEGLHFILPWDSITQYDRRLQSKEYTVTALTKGGLNVQVNMSVLWQLDPQNVGRLHITAGPEYRDRVLDPAVVSSVRSVIGSYEQSELYDGNPLKLQDEVMTLLNDMLVDASFDIFSIMVRKVQLPEDMADAIETKFVAEQAVLAERYRVLQAIESFKKTYVEAEGTRLEQSVISEGMSEEYLRYMGILATLELAQSDNSKLVIIGDKDGLPLLFNADTMETSPVLPQAMKPEDYIKPGEVGLRREDLMETYEKLQDYLTTIDDVLGTLMDDFPEAEEDIGESLLPQINQVPTAPEEE